MSGTSPADLAYSNAPHEDDNRSNPTRTLAIIKTHALQHRLAIERRILEASFEVRLSTSARLKRSLTDLCAKIVKERQMEFDTSSDQDFLQELFGRDVESLFE